MRVSKIVSTSFYLFELNIIFYADYALFENYRVIQKVCQYKLFVGFGMFLIIKKIWVCDKFMGKTLSTQP
jgi:hypothetical protein